RGVENDPGWIDCWTGWCVCSDALDGNSLIRSQRHRSNDFCHSRGVFDGGRTGGLLCSGAPRGEGGSDGGAKIRMNVVRSPWSVVRSPWSVVRSPWSVVRHLSI